MNVGKLSMLSNSSLLMVLKNIIAKFVHTPIEDSVISEKNFMENVEELRVKIQKMGWKLQEVPVRNGNEIAKWKFAATRGEQTILVEGANLLEGLQNVGLMLGIRK